MQAAVCHLKMYTGSVKIDDTLHSERCNARKFKNETHARLTNARGYWLRQAQT